MRACVYFLHDAPRLLISCAAQPAAHKQQEATRRGGNHTTGMPTWTVSASSIAVLQMPPTRALPQAHYRYVPHEKVESVARKAIGKVEQYERLRPATSNGSNGHQGIAYR